MECTIITFLKGAEVLKSPPSDADRTIPIGGGIGENLRLGKMPVDMRISA